MLENISIKKLKELRDIKIIDIRSNEKYNTSHIENSISIPYDNLIKNYKKLLKRDEIYYIYCQSGKTSIKACILLYKLGYKSVNILGGYEAYLLI